MAEASPTKIYDIYASILNFKKSVDSLLLPYRSLSWIPEEHERRLQAYEILTALYWNYSRDYRFAPESGDTSYNDLILEDGTPAWLCNRIKAKLLGDKITLAVKRPRSVRNISRVKAKLNTADEAGKAGLQADLDKRLALSEQIQEREEYLLDWFEDNNVAVEIDTNETKASYLGDMAYMVTWNKIEGKPEIATYDPGFVFPIESPTGSVADSGTPVVEQLFIAWEEEDPDTDATYRIWRDVWEVRELNGVKSCYRQFAYYTYDGTAELSLDDFSGLDVVEGTDSGWIKLPIDFIPVLMIPNASVEGQTYGISNLHFHVALLDAIINNATDLKKNSEKLGGAIVALAGKDVSIAKDPTTKLPVPIEVEPNTVYPLGENGSLTLLDTSGMQEALLKTLDKLQAILIRNSQITEVGAGTIGPQDLSGIALKLLVQPLLELIGPMRTIRERNYSTLFWMVQRMWQVFGTPEEKRIFADPLYDVVVKFGSVIPNDRKAQLEEYTLLKDFVGEETALRMAQEEGMDIDVDDVIAKKSAARQQAVAEQMDAFMVRREVDGSDQQGA